MIGNDAHRDESMTTEIRASIPARRNFHLADMSPAYFGLVMSTGIVSLAAWLAGYPGIASSLFALNIVQFAVLAVLYGARSFPLACTRPRPGKWTRCWTLASCKYSRVFFPGWRWQPGRLPISECCTG